MKHLSRCWTGLVLAFLYLPIGVLILYSFNASKSRSVWAGFFPPLVSGPVFQ